MSNSLAVWARTLAMIAFLLLAVWECAVALSAHVRPLALAIGLAIFMVELAALFTLILYLAVRKAIQQFRARRRLRVENAIREALLRYAMGTGDSDALAAMAASSHREFEDCMAEFLGLVKGDQAKRLAGLAQQLGIARTWIRRARSRDAHKRLDAFYRIALLPPGAATGTLLSALEDRDEAIRLEAMAVLARDGDLGMIDRVLDFAANQSPLVRAVLAENLRPRAPELSSRLLPDALRSGDPRRIAAFLEVAAAWQRALSIDGFDALLRHESDAVRAGALRLLPYVGGVSDPAGAVADGLLDPNPAVRRVAAETARRLGGRIPIEALLIAMHDTDEEVALHAAEALSLMGNEGLAALEAETASGDQLSAGLAAEALERAQTGRAWNP
jgi:HEAT repeat protein